MEKNKIVNKMASFFLKRPKFLLFFLCVSVMLASFAEIWSAKGDLLDILNQFMQISGNEIAISETMLVILFLISEALLSVAILYGVVSWMFNTLQQKGIIRNQKQAVMNISQAFFILKNLIFTPFSLIVFFVPPKYSSVALNILSVILTLFMVRFIFSRLEYGIILSGKKSVAFAFVFTTISVFLILFNVFNLLMLYGIEANIYDYLNYALLIGTGVFAYFATKKHSKVLALSDKVEIIASETAAATALKNQKTEEIFEGFGF